MCARRVARSVLAMRSRIAKLVRRRAAVAQRNAAEWRVQVRENRVARAGPSIPNHSDGEPPMNATDAGRRSLLRFLAASPLVAAPGVASGIAALFASTPNEARAQSYDVLRDAAQKLDADGVINSPAQALNVFDFEPAAKKALAASPAHFGYLASGGDDDSTLRANREAFSDYTIRVRRLVDARNIDTSVKIFGETWASPIFLCPVSSQAAFNFAERELGVARAAGKRGHQMVLST